MKFNVIKSFNILSKSFPITLDVYKRQLKYYFDCSQKDGKELFKDLKIMEQEEKYTSKLGAYPCIYLTLKDAGSVSYTHLDVYKRQNYCI